MRGFAVAHRQFALEAIRVTDPAIRSSPLIRNGVDALAHIYLEDTFVLAWDHGQRTLTFHVLASLLQTHPAAFPPLPGEWACYRHGLLQFVGVTSVCGLLRQDTVNRTTDASGAVDYGCIDAVSLLRPGEYRIDGELGKVVVLAERLEVLLAAG